MLDDSFKIRYKSLPVAISESKGFWPTNLHNHNEFEILLITSGSSVAHIANREYELHSGDMVFINPMEIHEVTVNTNAPYSHKCICFDISIIMGNHLYGNLSDECMSIVHKINGNDPHCIYLKELFNKIYDAHIKDEKTVAMEISAYITLMFSYLLKNSLFNEKRISNKQTKFCLDVIEYIKNNYGDSITSKQAADACFLNHSYFCRKFKKCFGIRFSEYLNIHRLSLARKMLEENVESITEISAQCGFDTPAYFSKCFKKYVGVLPYEYKKSKRS